MMLLNKATKYIPGQKISVLSHYKDLSMIKHEQTSWTWSILEFWYFML